MGSLVPILLQLLPSLASTAGKALFPEGSPEWMRWANLALAAFVNGGDVPDKIQALDARIKAMVELGRAPSEAEWDEWLVVDAAQSDQIEAAARAHGLI